MLRFRGTERALVGASGDVTQRQVAHTFSTNGNVNLSFAQTNGGRNTVGLKQWTDVPLHLTH